MIQIGNAMARVAIYGRGRERLRFGVYRGGMTPGAAAGKFFVAQAGQLDADPKGFDLDPWPLS